MNFLEKNKALIIIVFIIGVIWLFNSVNGEENKTEKSLKKENNSSQYSIDDAKKLFKTLTYKQAVKELNSKTPQMFYIGCRYCGHCQHLEENMTKLLKKHASKNKKRDLIYAIEAGFSCVPKKDSTQYANYEKVYQYLVDNKIIEANDQKSFGTPQFIFVKDGKVVDTMNKYMMKEGDRNVKAMEEMFKANNYRGFKNN